MNIEPNELAEEAAVAHVALAIVDLMARNKASQRQLANVLGVSEARVSQILGAEQNLTVKTIARIASGLGHRLELKFVAEPEYAAQELVESQKTIDALGTLVTNAAFANAGLQNERDQLQARLTGLIAAASAFGLPDNPAFDTPKEKKLRAALSRAKGE